MSDDSNVLTFVQLSMEQRSRAEGTITSVIYLQVIDMSGLQIDLQSIPCNVYVYEWVCVCLWGVARLHAFLFVF